MVLYDAGGVHAFSVTAVDVNHDGKPDLLVSNSQSCTNLPPSDGCIGVLLGNGDGTFQPAVTFDSGGIGAGSLSAADFDGDGKLDVVVANRCNHLSCANGVGTVSLLFGNGDGTFRQPLIYGTDFGANRPVVGDLNGDDMPDLVVGNTSRNSLGLGSVSILLNRGTANDTQPPKITLNATGSILSAPLGDLLRVPISGTIFDKLSGVNPNNVTYTLTDMTGKVRQKGAVYLGLGGSYSQNVFLRASVNNPDLAGRYVVTVQAKDNAGNVGSKKAVVNVTH